MYRKQEKMNMTLAEYFSTEPRGARMEMAEYLGITPTYLSMLIYYRRRPSNDMAIAIEKATQGLVTRKDLLPHMYTPFVQPTEMV
jgi:DNA-binding transcriptional regulator YdaS (Cro superfamily)